MMQTIVLKISLTVDPVRLVEWAKSQMDVCCTNSAHKAKLLDWVGPEAQAQNILAHAFFSAVPEEITDGGCIETLETGIPSEIVARLEREFQAAFAEFYQACESCGKPATEGFVANPYPAEIYGKNDKQWYCKKCYQSNLDEI